MPDTRSQKAEEEEEEKQQNDLRMGRSSQKHSGTLGSIKNHVWKGKLLPRRAARRRN
jgi:hypothetical protein